MTTEIAIMNKSAVALAADSAVTISITGPQGQNNKVLNTANKLYSLSKYAPAGLMIYGKAAMLGIPWETIVKMYREMLEEKEFDTLEEYTDSFFNFLGNFNIAAEIQEFYVENIAEVWFRAIHDILDKWVAERLSTGKGQVSASSVKTKLRDLISTEYRESLKSGSSSTLSSKTRSELRNKYRNSIQGVIKEVFENHPITSRMRTELITIAINAASVGLPNQSGVVIAGFGKKDLYPKCFDFDVAAVFAGKAIKKNMRSQTISHHNSSVIMPFAQSGDVKTFMEGVGPSIDGFLRGVYTDMELLSIVVDGIMIRRRVI